MSLNPLVSFQSPVSAGGPVFTVLPRVSGHPANPNTPDLKKKMGTANARAGSGAGYPEQGFAPLHPGIWREKSACCA